MHLFLWVGGVVLLLPGCTSALRGPGTVRGLVGRTLSVTCHYDKSYRTYNKYWCKGDDWYYCTIVVMTRGLEAEVKAGRTSIKDNYTCSCFTVTLENLMEADAGKYWCAIERTGADIHVPVTVLVEYGADLTGPKGVVAVVGSSVPVVCSYDQRYQQNTKYWCRIHESSCQPIVTTIGSEQPVITNRVSIKDNHSLNHFTVTMDDLTSNDSGMYSCAVTRTRGRDLMAPVNVTVLSQTDQSGFSFKPESTSIRFQCYVSFLILICLKTPMLLTMVLVLIWMRRRNRQLSDEVTRETHP